MSIKNCFTTHSAHIDGQSDLVEQLRALEAELGHVHARLSVLVEGSPLGIFFDDPEDKCMFVNSRFCEMMELSPDEALGDGWARTVHPEDLLWLLRDREQSVTCGLPVFHAEYRYICKSGRQGWVEEQTRPVHGTDGRLLGYVGTLAEITSRKRAEQMLARYNEDLETRVRERTAELEAQTARLAEMNAALKVLLRQRDEDRDVLERSVLTNVRHCLNPVLDRLEKGASPATLALCAEARQELNTLTSPFLHRLSVACQDLTPAELQVVRLIRQGLTTKEIARRLDVSTATIDSHRHHVRRKLGLDHRQTSLRAHLMSLDPS